MVKPGARWAGTPPRPVAWAAWLLQPTLATDSPAHPTISVLLDRLLAWLGVDFLAR